MGKTAFLFAGQGAQKVGMCKDLYEKFDFCKEALHKADSLLDMKISEIILNGSQEELNKTEVTQPAIVAANMMCLLAAEHHGIKCHTVCGLSLGEYSALIHSGAMSFEEAIPLVKKRGSFMQQAVPIGEGSMAAVLNLSDEDVQKACDESKEFGIVECVNFNCPGQVAIAGEVNAVDKAIEAVSKMGGKCIKLNVSGPFHSSMMKPAAKQLGEELKKIHIESIKGEVYSNVTGEKYKESDDIRDMLTKQVMSPVHFSKIIRNMISDGVDTFIEIGPGKTLSRFVKRIDKSVRIFNIEDLTSLEKTVKNCGV